MKLNFTFEEFTLVGRISSLFLLFITRQFSLGNVSVLMGNGLGLSMTVYPRHLSTFSDCSVSDKEPYFHYTCMTMFKALSGPYDQIAQKTCAAPHTLDTILTKQIYKKAMYFVDPFCHTFMEVSQISSNSTPQYVLLIFLLAVPTALGIISYFG